MADNARRGNIYTLHWLYLGDKEGAHHFLDVSLGKNGL